MRVACETLNQHDETKTVTERKRRRNKTFGLTSYYKPALKVWYHSPPSESSFLCQQNYLERRQIDLVYIATWLYLKTFSVLCMHVTVLNASDHAFICMEAFASAPSGLFTTATLYTIICRFVHMRTRELYNEE